MSLGFHPFDPTVRPQTQLAQREDYYDEFTIPAAQKHRPGAIIPTLLRERLPVLGKVTTPNRLLWLLVPFGVIAMFRFHARERIVLAAPLIGLVAFYAMFAYLLPWYCVVVAPAVILLVLLGKDFFERNCGTRHRPIAGAVLSIALVAAAVTSLPGVDREMIDDGYPAPVMWFSYVEAKKTVQQPAIILFRYRPGDNINEEPVYNVDAMTPDDAPIIRAHDLGPARNAALFDYYAKRQPQRTVYLFDRATRTLLILGNVAELARQRGATSTTITAPGFDGPSRVK